MKARRRRSAGLIPAAIVAGWAFFGVSPPASAETAAGTVISNTSTASYQDSSSNSYNANSNTVLVTVQNAPSMTVTASSNKIVAPGQTITDSFTIQNTGNAAGDVQLTAGGVTGGSDIGSTTGTVTYTYGGATFASLSVLNGVLANVSVAVSGTIVVNVVYTVAPSATVGDVQTNLTGTMTYPALTGAVAQTSSAVSATTAEDDAVQIDALLDVALSAATLPGTITYTLGAVNRNTVWGAKDLQAVKTLLGPGSAGTGGIFLSIKVPQYPANTPLTISGNAGVSTSTTYGFATGATAALYSTANATGASGWTAGATPVSGATYIGVYIYGGSCTINGTLTSGVEICPIASSGSSAGVVPNPAVTLTFSVTPSAASGSANSGSTQTIGNSLIGSNGTIEYVVGPGITANTLPDGTADTTSITAPGAGINNTTTINAPSGASVLNSTQSVSAYAVANGPFGNPSATGMYDGSPSNDNNHDFTAVSFVSTNSTYTTTNTTALFTPTVATTTAAAVSNINVESTLANLGNLADSYTVVATAPSGWSVVLESDNGGTPGASLGGAAVGATSTATGVAVASGGTLNYWAVYGAPSGVAYLSHGVATIVATSVGNSGVSNTTVHLLYAGFVAVTTTATTTPNCPAAITAAAGTVCPGGTIVYVIDYRNIVKNTDVSSVPAVSFARVMTKAGSFTITADGSTNSTVGNNWGTTTNGPTAIPVDTTPGTTYAYWSGASGATPAASFQAGLTKFVATVGGPTFQLAPFGYSTGTGTYGTITYSVVAK